MRGARGQIGSGVVRLGLSGEADVVVVLGAVVTGNALFVEHRLDQEGVAEGARAFGSGLDLGGFARQRKGFFGCGGRGEAVLVAADARSVLAGLEIGEAAHDLDGAALGVKGLEAQRNAGGGTEIGAAIGLDGDGPQDLLTGGSVGETDAGLVGVGGGFRQDLYDTQAGDSIFRQMGSALVDVVNEEDAFGRPVLRGLGQGRRHGAGTEGNGPQAAYVRVAVEEFFVAVAVGEVEAEHVGGVGGGFADERVIAIGGQKQVFGEGPGTAVAVSGPALGFDGQGGLRGTARSMPLGGRHAGFAFWEGGIGRKACEGVQSVDAVVHVDANDGACGHGVMGRGGGYDPGRARHGAGLPDAHGIEGVISEIG